MSTHTEAYFRNIKQVIATRLGDAKNSIYIAVAWFTDRDLFEILLEKAKAGLIVELIITDDEINQLYGAPFSQLSTSGGKYIKVAGAGGSVIMHNKFCIIDMNIVLTGSYNWSNRARQNHENITITSEDPELALQFFNEFCTLKEQYDLHLDSLKPFDYYKVSQRLALVKQLIRLFETDEIPSQIFKLNEYELIDEVQAIVRFLEKKQFAEALTSIEELEQKYSGLIRIDDHDVLLLKLELRYLEIEYSSLEAEKVDIQRDLDDFRYRYLQELGDLERALLNLKAELARLTNREEKAKEYEEAEAKFKEQADSLINSPAANRIPLSPEEQESIKKLYRKGARLCHPDVVDEAHKALAHEYFIALKDAYDRNDLEEVKRIVSVLESGEWNVSNPSATVSEKQKLSELISQLRTKVENLKSWLDAIKDSPDYKAIVSISDFDEYFSQRKSELKDEIKFYKKSIKNQKAHVE